MAKLVYVLGLDNKSNSSASAKKGFRIKASGGHYRTVTNDEAVQVDLEDREVQKVLKRNGYRVLTSGAASGVFTPYLT